MMSVLGPMTSLTMHMPRVNSVLIYLEVLGNGHVRDNS